MEAVLLHRSYGIPIDYLGRDVRELVIRDGDADDLLWFCRAVAREFSATFDCLHNIHAFKNLAENGVISIKPRGGNSGEEKLGAARVFTCVRHGENSWLVVLQAKG